LSFDTVGPGTLPLLTSPFSLMVWDSFNPLNVAYPSRALTTPLRIGPVRGKNPLLCGPPLLVASCRQRNFSLGAFSLPPRPIFYSTRSAILDLEQSWTHFPPPHCPPTLPTSRFHPNSKGFPSFSQTLLEWMNSPQFLSCNSFVFLWSPKSPF